MTHAPTSGSNQPEWMTQVVATGHRDHLKTELRDPLLKLELPRSQADEVAENVSKGLEQEIQRLNRKMDSMSDEMEDLSEDDDALKKRVAENAVKIAASMAGGGIATFIQENHQQIAEIVATAL